MRSSLRSWKSLLGKLGLKLVERNPQESRARHQQRQLHVESLERRDLMATLYWDTNGSTPGLGGVGTWNTSAANWTTDPTGSSTTQVWNNAAGDEAVFTGTGAGVTVGSGIQVSSLKIEANGYTLSGGTLSVNGTGEVQVASSVSATIATQLVGSTQLHKTGTGTLTLSGNNTLSGGSSLESGVVALNHNSALGAGAITLAGGSLQAGNASRTLSNAIVATASTTSEISSPSGKNLTLNGNISGSGTIWKTGTASVFLGGDNSAFSGTFSHHAGNVYFNAANSGSEAAAWEINGGVTLGANFSGDATIKLGTLFGTAGNITSNTGITGTKTFEIGQRNESGTFTGKFTNSASGTTALKKIGSGTLTLTSSTTNYTGGTTVSGGTIVFGSGNALGTGTITMSGGSLQATSGNRTLSNNIVVSASTTNRIIAPSGSNVTLSGNLSGSGTLQKAGVNPLYLTGNNTSFSGTFSNREGSVFLNNVNAASAAAIWDISGGSFLGANFSGNATLQFGSLTGTTGTVSVANGMTGIKTYLVGARNEDFTFAATIADAVSGGGKVVLEKVGSGTMEMAGALQQEAITTASAGLMLIAKTGTSRSQIQASGMGRVECVLDKAIVQIGANIKHWTANPNAALSQAASVNNKSFTFTANQWFFGDRIAILTGILTDIIGVAPETKIGSSNVKYRVAYEGSILRVWWEDSTDDDYNDWYNDITETYTTETKTLPEGSCPCECAQNESNKNTGANEVTDGTHTSNTPPITLQNIQTAYTIAGTSGLTGLTAIRATLTLGSSVSQAYYYSTASLLGGDVVQLNLLVDASGESSGEKAYTIALEYLDAGGSTLFSDSVEGRYTLINRDDSAFGHGWWRNDLVQLTFDGEYASVIYGDGQDNVAFFDNSRLFYSVSADSAERRLERDGANYRLSDKFGNVTMFDSAGHLLSTSTATGLTTTYTYVAGNPDLLETVTAPDGDVTRYTYETYAGGTKHRVATMVEHDQTINTATTSFAFNSTSDNLLTQTTRTTADMTPVIKTLDYAYDPTTQQITAITDSENNTTTISYDFAGRVSSIQRACGGTTELEAFQNVGLVDRSVVGDSLTNLATLTKSDDSNAIGYEEDERGNPHWFNLNHLGQTVWEKDALGNETTYTYDQNGNLLSTIAADPDGAGGNEAIETLYTYDAKGNQLTQTERTAVGHVVLSTQSWTYDANFGTVTSHTDEIGRVTKYVIGALGGDLNDDGRVLSETRIVGLDDDTSSETDDVTTTYTYGSVSYGSIVVSGLLTSVTDANGHSTSYEYYDNVSPNSGKLGLLKKITNPDSTFLEFDYDTHGNRRSETDELGRTTTYSYDGENRMISRTDPDPDGAGPLAAPTWSYEYDGNNNQTKIIDPLGRATIMVYNNRTWLAERIEEGGITTSYTYNCVGDMVTTTDPLGRVTTYTYDDLNRQISVTLPDPDGAGALTALVISTTYDNLGRMLTTTDANGNVTSYGYDQHGFQTTVTLADPDGAGPLDAPVYTSVYDDAGQLIASIDPLGRTTTYDYDDLGRQVSVTMPDPDGAGPLAAPVYVTTYDKVGNVLTSTDALGNVTSYGYDDRDRTISVTMPDPDGVGPQFAPTMLTVYDDAGQVTSTTDALGRVTIYTYDDLGRRIAVTMPDPDGAGPLDAPVITTTYDVAGQVLSTTDALGNVTSYEYDDLGRQVKVTQPDPDDAGPLTAPEWITAYDDAGQVTSTTDPLGRTTSYEYDNLGRTITVTLPDPDGAGVLTSPTSSTTYDANGNVLTTTDALGNVTSYTYDALNRRTHTTQADPDGAGSLASPVWETVYDIASQITASIDPLGRTTTYEYDDLGRQTKVTSPDPDGAGPQTAAFTLTTYDAVGNVLSTTDALGNVTSYEYDDLGRQVKVTQPDPDDAGPLTAPEWITAYDDAGQVTSTTDPLGRTTSYEYDNLGRTITVTLPDPDGAGVLTSPTSSTTYDANGNVLTTTDALGNVTSYTYDALNRRTHTTQADPDGAGSLASPVWETVYDIASQVVASIDPLGRMTTYEYDDLGRQTKLTSPDPDGAGPQTAAFTFKTYDAVGNILTTEDALGYTTSYEYDNLYRLISSTNANLEETSYTYDLVGNRLTLTDPNHNTTTWEYDDLNRVVAETNELNKTRTYVYDVGGRLTSKVDRLGREVEYVYDNLNRVIEELWDNVSEYTWTYDAAGQVLTGGNAATREYVYTYDDLGRVTQVDTNEYGSGSVYDLNWTYDANGNMLTRSHAANTTSWTYDALNRATDVSSTGAVGTYGAAFSYNAVGQLTAQENRDTSVSGDTPFSRSEYAYDGAGRLTEITHKDPLSAAFASYGYSWSAGNRITAVNFLDGVYDNEDVDYSYDNAGQVTSADRVGSGADEAYDYDDNGNREVVTRDGSTTSWGVGTNNQLTSDGTNSYSYDDEGNLINDGISTYYWDHRNRLIEVRTGSTGVMYTYDVNNLRVVKILDLDGDWDYSDPIELDTQTNYYFDGGRMVREVSTDGTVENNYLFGINGQLTAVEDVANDVIEFTYNDHLGSVRDLIVVGAGAAVHTEHNVYDSFGRVVERQQFDGTNWNVVSNESIVSLGYTGEYFDVATGLQYNWNRWYDADTGDWLSEDPIGFTGGDNNLTRYVANNPIVAIDYSGLWKNVGDELGNPNYYMAQKGDKFEEITSWYTNDKKFRFAIKPVPLESLPSPSDNEFVRKNKIATKSELKAAWKDGNANKPVDCGVYDMSYLDSPPSSAGDYVLSLGSDQTKKEYVSAKQFFGNTIPITAPVGKNAVNELGKLSSWGQKPIKSLVLIGHHLRAFWGSNGIGDTFNDGFPVVGQVDGKLSTTDFLRPNTSYVSMFSYPSFEDAVEGKLSPGFWLGRDAQLMFFGCVSDTLAIEYSQEMLWKGASAYGSKKFIGLETVGGNLVAGFYDVSGLRQISTPPYWAGTFTAVQDFQQTMIANSKNFEASIKNSKYFVEAKGTN